MKVSGFTFIRNAILYDYPVVEAIRSILPLCDEVVVAVGKSEDNTLDLIRRIDKKKVKIVETVWDDNLREGGRVLAVETDKAFSAISPDSDWAFYIQGDEVLHEKYLPVVKRAMEQNLENENVDGLLFDYLHFYGSYDYVGDSYKWYPHEIRVIRNDSSIYAYRDAQGFRKGKNKKLSVRSVDAFIYHYGWVKPPDAMQRKQQSFHKLWHDDQWVNENIEHGEHFVYEKHIRSLKYFTSTHPRVMQARIQAQNWHFDYDLSFNRTSLKDRFKRILKQTTGIELIRKNYKLIN